MFMFFLNKNVRRLDFKKISKKRRIFLNFGTQTLEAEEKALMQRNVLLF